MLRIRFTPNSRKACTWAVEVMSGPRYKNPGMIQLIESGEFDGGAGASGVPLTHFGAPAAGVVAVVVSAGEVLRRVRRGRWFARLIGTIIGTDERKGDEGVVCWNVDGAGSSGGGLSDRGTSKSVAPSVEELARVWGRAAEKLNAVVGDRGVDATACTEDDRRRQV